MMLSVTGECLIFGNVLCRKNIEINFVKCIGCLMKGRCAPSSGALDGGPPMSLVDF